MAKETYDPHKSTEELRAGDKRQMNLRVLVISFAAIVAIFAFLYFAAFLLGYLRTDPSASPTRKALWDISATVSG